MDFLCGMFNTLPPPFRTMPLYYFNYPPLSLSCSSIGAGFCLQEIVFFAPLQPTPRQQTASTMERSITKTKRPQTKHWHVSTRPPRLPLVSSSSASHSASITHNDGPTWKPTSHPPLFSLFALLGSSPSSSSSKKNHQSHLLKRYSIRQYYSIHHCHQPLPHIEPCELPKQTGHAVGVLPGQDGVDVCGCGDWMRSLK